MNMLENKVGMIFGVANKRSIAWACAAACASQGAKLAFTYQGERLKENVESLASGLVDSLVVPCDVTDQAAVDAAFVSVSEKYGRLDFRHTLDSLRTKRSPRRRVRNNNTRSL